MTDHAERLFLEAIELPPGDRARFLDLQCPSPELRAEVESLLQGDDFAEAFLQSAVVEAAGTLDLTPETPLAGSIGPWRLTREIGRGGMGVVYAADRSDGLFALQVAIKIIRHRPGQQSLTARFDRERRILAGLAHPNIARLYDGGATPDGSPYLVMEFVDGVPVDEWVRLHSLSVRQTVQLFLSICAGVEHAHRNFIVHRDLKPANILVTNDGTVKLLDFGIARILSDQPQTPETQTIALTLEYASPEQVRGEPATTATDVYALGAVLYRLLTGETPLSLGAAPLDDCLRAILDRPPRDPLELHPAIGDDLAHITLRALRKEPDRRYQSVEALRLDLERFLRGLPVEARGNSPAYLASRFLRRHWLPVTAATLIFLSILGALIASRRAQSRAEAASMAAQQARLTAERERATADAERRKSEAAAREAERQRTLADHNAAALRLEVDRANRNLAAARAIASSFTFMFDRQLAAGKPREALAALDPWLKLQRDELTANPSNLAARKLLGILESRRCVFTASDNPLFAPAACQESIRLLDAVLASGPQQDDEWLRLTLAISRGTLGQLRSAFGKPAEAIPLCLKALDDIQAAFRINPNDKRLHRVESMVRLNLANAYAASSRIPDALASYRDSERALLDVPDPDKASGYMLLGVTGAQFARVLSPKDPAAAESLMAKALSFLRQAADSPSAGALESNEFANALNDCPYPRLRDPAAALLYARRAATATKESNPNILDTLAWAYFHSGDRANALETARKAKTIAAPSSPIARLIEKAIARFEKPD